MKFANLIVCLMVILGGSVATAGWDINDVMEKNEWGYDDFGVLTDTMTISTITIQMNNNFGSDSKELQCFEQSIRMAHRHHIEFGVPMAGEIIYAENNTIAGFGIYLGATSTKFTKFLYDCGFGWWTRTFSLEERR